MSFIKGEPKNFCCSLQLSNLPPILLPCSKRQGHQVTNPKFQLVTQITDLPIMMSSWPFAFPLQWRMRHSLNQNDSHGQFYKTNRSTEPPPTPSPPVPPAGPACSLSPCRQELIIRKTFPTPDNAALLAKSPVWLEERVWQSKYLQKQLESDAKSRFWGTLKEVFTRKGFSVGHRTAQWGCWFKVHSGSISVSVSLFHARTLFTEYMNNYIYHWRVNSEMYQFRTTGKSL